MLPVKRDNQILQHTSRMQVTTQQALHALFFSMSTINAVSQVVIRLVKHGYLARHPLWHKSHYYTLGKRCTRLFGVARSKTMPRGEQVLPVDLGTLAFCCLGSSVHKRLLPHELLARYPWFPKQYFGHPFCITKQDGVTRLASIKVELADYPHQVMRKHIKQLHEFRKLDPFRELIEERRFMVITITTTPERRDALIAEFAEEHWYPPSAVYDYPDLCNLL